MAQEDTQKIFVKEMKESNHEVVTAKHISKTVANWSANQSANQSILRDSTLSVHWEGRCWSWGFDSLPTWCEEPTHWKRPRYWKRLKAGGEEGDRGCDGWMASPTQCTWAWANSRRQWGQGGLVCCSPWGHKESDVTERLNSNVSGTRSCWGDS